MFQCVTCSETLVNSEATKHFSSTRHKSAKFIELDEIISCEDCDNQNVHQLKILRYGLSDMSLLCIDCIDKSKKEASAQYSLENGAFFSKAPGYFKFRDIECVDCQRETDLHVSSKANLVVCVDCLPKHGKIAFVSEKDDKFLTELLGIKETVPTKSSKYGGRKLGRKRPAKPVTAEQEARRAYYHENKEKMSILKSNNTVKAIGSVVPSGTKPGGKSGKFGGASGKFGSDKKPVSKFGNEKKPTGKFGNESKPVKSGNKGKSEKPGKFTDKANGVSDKFANLKLENSSSTGILQKTSNDNKAVKTANASAGPGKRSGPNSRISSKTNSKTNSGINSPDTNSRINSNQNSLNSTRSSTPIPKEKPTSTEYQLSEFISQELKLQPKLTFSSQNEYFREVCYNMFVEESLAGENTMLTNKDVLIEWYGDQDKKNKQFKVTIHAKNDVAQLYIPDKMRTVKKKPFSRNQSFFLVLDGTTPWYGYIADIAEHPKKKLVLEMIIVLYPWNDTPLPKNANVSRLTLLPSSVPVARVFQAMTGITNPKFMDMLLGNKPIKQIVFDNHVNFSSQNMNGSQKIAVQSVLNNAITVLQGPPGTGKTSTIYEIILQLLNSLNTYPILVVASSNIAVDNIAEKLMATHAQSLIRITSTEKEKEYPKSHPLGSICLHHRTYTALPQKYKDITDDMKRGAMKLGPKGYSAYLNEKIAISDQLVAQAKVIFTTTVSAGSPQLKNLKSCPVVIMDEATQSSEPTTLIPLSMPDVRKFVFVGDQKQLSCFSLIPKLSLSLFERVLLNGIYRNIHMLDVQYRMHPNISEFPIARFYQGKLHNGITAEQRQTNGIPPVYFFDTKGSAPESTISNRLREDFGRTYINRKEVEYILQVVKSLIIEKGIERSEIGIITPYSGQRDLISSVLVKDDIINPTKQEMIMEVDKEDIYNESKPVTIHIVSDIMVASIDAFQGREKNFMVMSCVRSNNKNTIGFLKDERRLNVALTRARYGMVIVGDAKFLQSSDKLWGEFVTYLSDKDWVHSTLF